MLPLSFYLLGFIIVMMPNSQPVSSFRVVAIHRDARPISDVNRVPKHLYATRTSALAVVPK